MTHTVLAKVIHGSHLFGLNTELSDQDFVTVVLPSARSVLLGQTHFINAGGDSTRKNNSDDVDDKVISFATFMEHVANSTLDMLEVLNAPLACHVVEPHPLFLEARRLRRELSNKNVDRIVGFCKVQAVNYSSKQGRYEAVKAVQDMLLSKGIDQTTKERALPYFEDIMKAGGDEYVKLEPISLPDGKIVMHIDICGRKVAETDTVAKALEMAAAGVKRYGKRVQNNAEFSRHDWKSISHALRIAHEGVEYLETGAITLPIRNRDHVLDMKLGRIPISQANEEVDMAVENLVDAAERYRGTEPLHPDLASDFIRIAHMHAVSQGDIGSCNELLEDLMLRLSLPVSRIDDEENLELPHDRERKSAKRDLKP